MSIVHCWPRWRSHRRGWSDERAPSVSRQAQLALTTMTLPMIDSINNRGRHRPNKRLTQFGIINSNLSLATVIFLRLRQLAARCLTRASSARQRCVPTINFSPTGHLMIVAPTSVELRRAAKPQAQISPVKAREGIRRTETEHASWRRPKMEMEASDEIEMRRDKSAGIRPATGADGPRRERFCWPCCSLVALARSLMTIARRVLV